MLGKVFTGLICCAASFVVPGIIGLVMLFVGIILILGASLE